MSDMIAGRLNTAVILFNPNTKSDPNLEEQKKIQLHSRRHHLTLSYSYHRRMPQFSLSSLSAATSTSALVSTRGQQYQHCQHHPHHRRHHHQHHHHPHRDRSLTSQRGDLAGSRRRARAGTGATWCSCARFPQRPSPPTIVQSVHQIHTPSSTQASRHKY